MSGYNDANPILRTAGILEDFSTPVPNYHVPVPPLGVGGIWVGQDRQDWPTVDPQVYELEGKVLKLGPKGITATEDDLYEARIKAIAASMNALGRQEKLFEDYFSAYIIEQGFKPNVTINGKLINLLGFDSLPIFHDRHPFDPIRLNAFLGNSFNLKLTPDNALKVKTNFSKVKDESGNPVFAGQPIEVALIVPANLEGEVEKVCERMYIAEVTGVTGGGVSNVMYKKAKPVVLTQLTDDYRWYMAVLNRPRKPMARIVMRPMQRKTLGPGTYQYEKTQNMDVFSYEKASYRQVDWRMWATSKG